MSILLCAATEKELASTIDFLQHADTGYEVDILITGVGLSSCTYHLTKQIHIKQPSFIIQAGIAGSLDESLHLGDVVIVEKDQIGDEGVMEKNVFKSVFELNWREVNNFPWQDGKLFNNTIDLFQEEGFPLVTGVTVNEITTDERRIAYYKNSLQAKIETLEGAAFHYVALMEKIPFLQLRSISNYIGDRDKAKWMLSESLSNLNSALQLVLHKVFSI
jgi:futalosine hydrolase